MTSWWARKAPSRNSTKKSRSGTTQLSGGEDSAVADLAAAQFFEDLVGLSEPELVIGSWLRPGDFFNHDRLPEIVQDNGLHPTTLQMPPQEVLLVRA